MWASLVNLHLLLSFLVGMIVVIMIVIFSYLNHLTFWLHAMNANKVIDVIDTDVSDTQKNELAIEFVKVKWNLFSLSKH